VAADRVALVLVLVLAALTIVLGIANGDVDAGPRRDRMGAAGPVVGPDRPPGWPARRPTPGEPVRLADAHNAELDLPLD
jgi:hypothetical protein